MSRNPFAGGGVWLWRSGARGLAGPLSPETLARSHPLLAADAARLGPWREVVLGAEVGAAAGDWLVAGGGAGQVPDPVCCVGHCESSLDVAWAFADAVGLPPFASVLAVSQDKGRGQMRRGWFSPPGNLYAALSWPADTGDLAAMAPVLVGVCLTEALDRRGFSACVKWPNDVLLGDRKVGGILLEERGGSVLAGIGLNLSSAPGETELRRDHAVPAAALSAFGEVPGAVTLWTELVKSVQTCYRLCVALSGSRELALFAGRHLAWIGREVLVRENASDGYRARIVGLAEDGGLRLRRLDPGPGLALTLHSGNISLL